MGELVKVVERKDVAPGSRTAVEVRGQKVAVPIPTSMCLGPVS